MMLDNILQLADTLSTSSSSSKTPEYSAWGQEAWQALVNKLHVWFNTAVSGLPNLFIAILILLVSLFLAKVITRTVVRLISRISHNESVNQLIGWFVRIFIIAFGLFASLSVLHLDKTVTSLLTGAGIIGLAISFAFQNNASNFISGVIIAIRKHCDIGDWIRIKTFYGCVTQININYTLIKAETGEIITLPNKMLIDEALINYTREKKKEVELHINIGYNADLDRVQKVAHQTISELNIGIPGTNIEVNFLSFKEYAIQLEVAFWIEFTAHKSWEHARNKSIMAIVKAFRNNGIEFQVPKNEIELHQDK